MSALRKRKDNIVARYIKNARFDQNTGPIPSEIDEDVECDGGLEFMDGFSLMQAQPPRPDRRGESPPRS